jgi:hypothetical protein
MIQIFFILKESIKKWKLLLNIKLLSFIKMNNIINIVTRVNLIINYKTFKNWLKHKIRTKTNSSHSWYNLYITFLFKMKWTELFVIGFIKSFTTMAHHFGSFIIEKKIFLELINCLLIYDLYKEFKIKINFSS